MTDQRDELIARLTQELRRANDEIKSERTYSANLRLDLAERDASLRGWVERERRWRATAPSGQIWVCGICGKISRDRTRGPHGWDASCTTHAVLCHEASLVLGEDGRARRAEAVQEVTDA